MVCYDMLIDIPIHDIKVHTYVIYNTSCLKLCKFVRASKWARGGLMAPGPMGLAGPWPWAPWARGPMAPGP